MYERKSGVEAIVLRRLTMMDRRGRFAMAGVSMSEKLAVLLRPLGESGANQGSKTNPHSLSIAALARGIYTN